MLVLERFPVHPDAIDEFERAVADRVERMRARTGLLWADATLSSEDRPSWVVLSEWRTPADASAWSSSTEAEPPAALLRGDPTRRRFTPDAS